MGSRTHCGSAARDDDPGMSENTRTSSGVWIHTGRVLQAYELVPAAHRQRCASDTASRAAWHLALDDDARNRLLPLPQPIARVGRGEHCDLCIDHPTVSHDHAALAVRRTSLILFTLGASGRTFLNGRRVEDRAQLADYDIVLFGDAMVVVRRIDAPVGVHPVRSGGARSGGPPSLSHVWSAAGHGTDACPSPPP